MINEIIIGMIMLVTVNLVYISIVISNSMCDRLKKVIEDNPKSIEQWKINTKYLKINHNKKLIKYLIRIMLIINVIALILLIVFAILKNSNTSEITISLYDVACTLTVCTIGLDYIIIFWRILVTGYIQSKLPFWA